MDLTRDRAKTLEELADVVSYFFSDEFQYEEKGIRKHFLPEGAAETSRGKEDHCQRGTFYP